MFDGLPPCQDTATLGSCIGSEYQDCAINLAPNATITFRYGTDTDYLAGRYCIFGFGCTGEAQELWPDNTTGVPLWPAAVTILGPGENITYAPTGVPTSAPTTDAPTQTPTAPTASPTPEPEIYAAAVTSAAVGAATAAATGGAIASAAGTATVSGGVNAGMPAGPNPGQSLSDAASLIEAVQGAAAVGSIVA
jgi:hypothetical protein